MKSSFLVVAAAAMLLGCFIQAGNAAATTGDAAFMSGGGDVDQELVGTWVYQGGDGGGSQKITLVLQSDGSYTKTLDANVQGAHYGGTHSGTWTSNGRVVHLSGDGNWPASTHDLSTFRKVR